MKAFVGIDLGTTNSAIAFYDGENLNICKSPEQNDVTPSAILIDKRGNKFVGKRAYDAAPINPDNSALLFKRLMGSNTKIKFAYSGEEKTPEECSAELLKVLHGYLPEELRNYQNLGTVITIPAAFNQMQKDATLRAAEMAGLGRIALMQEPVAAVMSVMRSRNTDGIFLIYDLGGGTLDVAIAESNKGRVNLLANGGIQMCGGRDIDRAIFDNIVKTWLNSQFSLPDDFLSNPKYKRLIRLANWAIEKAKIELSSKNEAHIALSEIESGVCDEAGEEIYVDIVLTRGAISPYVDERVKESVEAVRETLEKAALSSKDLDSIVFIGGPTNYKPLRDKVCEELGVAGNTEVNPMTAVAEGAALYAESIDWASGDNAKKSSRGKITSNQNDFKLSFAYVARTPECKARILAQVEGDLEEGHEFQVDSLDSGWSSGRQKLQHNASMVLNLTKNGDNNFKVFLFDSQGKLLPFTDNKIIITRTAATIEAITASHSISVAVKGKDSDSAELEWLVKAGEPLPKKGTIKFKAAESLKAGINASLNFKLYEGEILDPITDNRYIGMLKIRGTDFDFGLIHVGADLICEYEMQDSGNIKLNVSVPSIKTTFNSTRNFYSPQEGQIDFSLSSEKLMADADELLRRVENLTLRGVSDELLDSVVDKAERAKYLVGDEPDTEKNQEAQERLLEGKKNLDKVRRGNLQSIREIELETLYERYKEEAEEYARPSEKTSYEAMYRTAKRFIDREDRKFEATLDEMKILKFYILYRQDWYVIELFRWYAERPYNYSDRDKFDKLVELGEECIAKDDIQGLKDVLDQLYDIRLPSIDNLTSIEDVNIFRG